VYNRILLPTDGSEGTETAVEHAITHAKTYDAELHVLHVVDQSVLESTATPTVDGMAPQVIRDELDEQGRALVNEVAAQSKDAGVPVTTEILEYGRPHEKIHTYATENGIDLIVLGTHGRSGLNRQLLGSVTEKVVRTAEIPVLTVQLEKEQ
jgi:nucleotide-binding universal stress UspA family protein